MRVPTGGPGERSTQWARAFVRLDDSFFSDVRNISRKVGSRKVSGKNSTCNAAGTMTMKISCIRQKGARECMGQGAVLEKHQIRRKGRPRTMYTGSRTSVI